MELHSMFGESQKKGQPALSVRALGVLVRTGMRISSSINDLTSLPAVELGCFKSFRLHGNAARHLRCPYQITAIKAAIMPIVGRPLNEGRLGEGHSTPKSRQGIHVRVNTSKRVMATRNTSPNTIVGRVAEMCACQWATAVIIPSTTASCQTG